jgi:hypothetical protein
MKGHNSDSDLQCVALAHALWLAYGMCMHNTLTEPQMDVNYSVADRDLKYYIFDWDDNILHMPSRIHLERFDEQGQWVPHSVSTSLFSVIRSDTEHIRPPEGDWELAFREFRDINVDDENVFLKHTREVLDRIVRGEADGAPCFHKFRKVLVEGRLFAIVTARGHSEAIIRQGVEYFIKVVLSDEEKAEMLRNLRGYIACFDPASQARTDEAVLDYYLSHNKYHAVMSSTFRRRMGQKPGASPNTEAGKQFAIRDFVEHVLRIARERGLDKPISVGFSDDDDGNVKAVEAYVREALAAEFNHVKFVVYYTSDPEVPAGRKVVVRGQLSLDI